MIKQSRDRVSRWGPDGAPVFDLTQSLLDAIDAISELDERIARFETGAAYEREAFDADARQDIAYSMSKFVNNGDGTLSWPKMGGDEQDKPKSSKPLCNAERILWRASGLIDALDGIDRQKKAQIAVDIQRAIHEIQLIMDDSQ